MTQSTGVPVQQRRPLGLRRLRAGEHGRSRGDSSAARWHQYAYVGLLVGTAVLYLVGLDENGWANAFYAAAVQAGSQSWEAFFYGSSDAANAITVDKPPAFLWVIGISVRLFGLNSWSILVPQALMGVGSVAVLYRTICRRFSAGAALIAGTALATTPVAALMFRYNNPDALLTLLMILAIAATLRGIETGRMRWVVWAGVAIGFAFLTKQLQAFVIVLPLVGVYLWAAPVPWWKRIRHLLAAATAIVVSAGWWVAIVELVPASARPYIGGSQTNSFLELTFGYNGFGRVTGNETGSVTGGGGTTGGGSGSWGSTGLFRLFGSEFATQITWLLPTALVLLVAALIAIGFRHRTDIRLATVLVFGGALIVTGLVFSLMGGIFHPYYTVALAPYIAALVGIGGWALWQRRSRVVWRIVAAGAIAITVAWQWVLLLETPSWQPWIRWLILTIGVIAVVLVLVPGRRCGLAATLSSVLVVGMLAPAASSVATAAVGHTGAIPSAGPSVSAAGFGAGAGGAPGGGGPGTQGGGGPGTRTGTGPAPQTGNGTQGAARVPQTGFGTGTPGGGTGGPGSLLGGSTDVARSVKKALTTNADDFTWVAAAVGSNSAAAYQLASGYPVMAIGGYNGSDPSPTLAQFRADVSAGRIHWFIAGSVGSSNGGSDVSSKIAAWVANNFAEKTIGGVTMYDLTAGS